MGDRGHEPGAEANEVRREHATYHATFLAWPILAISNWSEPMLLVFTVTWLAMFVIFIWAIYKIERSLNDEGQSLTYPWRVPSPKKKALHIDGVLSTSIRRLRSGEDEEEVLSSLRLHLEGKLPREADRHYRRTVEGLRDAASRDWVFDAERRERALEEAEKELWMTRAEYLRELI